MKKILVIGSLNMDYSIELERRPEIGETVKAEKYIKSEGGKGANQAYTIGTLGGNVAMIGAVGKDENGKKLKKNLEDVNVDVSAIEEIENTQSGTAFVMVDRNGENNIIIIEGANRKSRKKYNR